MERNTCGETGVNTNQGKAVVTVEHATVPKLIYRRRQTHMRVWVLHDTADEERWWTMGRETSRSPATNSVRARCARWLA
jgi:hypothetical protein